MAQHLYGKNREEPYAPSYGNGQGSNTNKQSPKKPVFINYYPSGNTNNPQRIVAQVETVTREFVRNPGAATEPINETRNHHGDDQSKREDEFINRIRDETTKATAEFNNASRIIEPKVLSTNLDQLQLSDQPRNHHGWIEPPELADPSHPRKVAELMSRVSNWRGGAKPISSDGYNQLGYDQTRSYTISSYNNTDNGWSKLPNVSYGSSYNGNRGREADDVQQVMRRNDIINLQPSLTQQVRYDEAPRGTSTTYGNGYNSGLGNQSGRNYSSGLPRSSYVGRPASGGPTSSTSVITSIDAVTKYKGSFVPQMNSGEQRKPNVLMNI